VRVAERRRRISCTALLVAVVACEDATPPNDPNPVGRYALVTVDGTALPGLVYGSRSADGLAYDSMWVIADTLELRADSRAAETGVFRFNGKHAEETAPRLIPFTLTTGGQYRVDDRQLIVTTWLQVEDTVSRLNGGTRLTRATHANVARQRRKPVFMYQRLR
jgi:hypothetical protein